MTSVFEPNNVFVMLKALLTPREQKEFSTKWRAKVSNNKGVDIQRWMNQGTADIGMLGKELEDQQQLPG